MCSDHPQSLGRVPRLLLSVHNGPARPVRGVSRLLYFFVTILCFTGGNHHRIGIQIVPIVLLPVLAIAADPRGWLGCCALPFAMLTLNILTISSPTLSRSFYCLVGSVKGRKQLLGQNPDIEVLLLAVGPPSLASAELSGTAITLTDENPSKYARQDYMDENGTRFTATLPYTSFLNSWG